MMGNGKSGAKRRGDERICKRTQIKFQSPSRNSAGSRHQPSFLGDRVESAFLVEVEMCLRADTHRSVVGSNNF